MNPATTLLSSGMAGTALALGLALGRRLVSPLRFAQVVGGLVCGLVVVMVAACLLAGGGDA